MCIEYIEGDRIEVQGARNDIFKKHAKSGYRIKEHGNGNGNWLLVKKSDVTFYGKSCRKFVLKYYERKKLTEKLVNTFRKDYEEGKITKEMITLD